MHIYWLLNGGLALKHILLGCREDDARSSVDGVFDTGTGASSATKRTQSAREVIVHRPRQLPWRTQGLMAPCDIDAGLCTFGPSLRP